MTLALERSTFEPAAGQRQLGLSLRLALRELRSGIGGFYVFLGCIALGVAVIAAVSAVADGLTAGLERQGQTLLGGDTRVSRIHQRAIPEERAWIDGQGTVSETATLRSMARVPGVDRQSLVSLKAVDQRYPLFGSVGLKGAQSLAEMWRDDSAVAVDPLLLARLELRVGEEIRIGSATFRVGAIVESEPDRLVSRVTAGPRVFLSMAQLEKTQLVKPGTLIRWHYAIDMGAAAADQNARVAGFKDAVNASLPEAGFIVRDRRDPSPQVTRVVDRLREFLNLLGLAALIVGGIGVANAVATFVDRRRKTIGIYKSLGASSATVNSVFLLQVLILAGLGVILGLFAGYALPAAVLSVLGDDLPFAFDIGVSPLSALLAAAYGILVAAVFVMWPLARAEQIRPSVLFRESVGETTVWPGRKAALIAGAAIAALGLLAVFTSGSPVVTAGFLGAVVCVLAVFFGLGVGATRLARHLPRSRHPELALALGNVGSPGGLTRSVVVSLGTGLSLLVAVALLDATFVAELKTRLPKDSPNYFVLDVPKRELGGFEQAVKRVQPDATLASAPMLRGRIVRLKDKTTDKIKANPNASWVLNGDRGLTYAATLPKGSKVVEGDWWPADHAGEPLVSFDAGIGKELGLAIGDTITVNVLGRNVTARIANFREVNWASLAINFVMVFSPNALAGAPHNWLATIRLPDGAALDQEVAVSRAVGQALPSATIIRVKDAIEAFGSVFEKIMLAVRAAGGVTLLAGALVIAGALATGHRRRIMQAVVLKVVGATQWRVVKVHLLEYLMLSALAASVAIGVGVLAAWVAATYVLDMQLVISGTAILQIVLFAVGLVLAFGAIGTRQVLKARTVTYLRSE